MNNWTEDYYINDLYGDTLSDVIRACVNNYIDALLRKDKLLVRFYLNQLDRHLKGL